MLSRATVLVFVGWMVMAQSCFYFRTSDRKAGKAFEKKGLPLTIGYLTTGNFTLHYAKTGNDSLPTLLFLHGSPGSWDAFEDYLADADLLKRFRLVSVDRPGFGYTQFGDAANLSEQSALIMPLLKEIHNKRPVYLVGHSMGGPVALRLAIDSDTNLISGVVLLAASIDPAAEMPENWRGFFSKSPWSTMLPGAFRPSNKELWWLKTDLVQLENDLVKLKTPVWIAHGKRDMLVPFSNVSYAQQKFPGLRRDTLVWENANHFIPWSHYNDVKRFLLGLPLD